jgi:transposase
MACSSERIGNRVAIKKLHSAGFKYKEISRILRVNYNTVCRWVNRSAVEDRIRSGRPCKISGRLERLVDRESIDKWTDQGGSTRAISKLLKRSGHNISHMSVQRYFKKKPWGHPYKQRTKPLLSRRNITDRKNFCDSLIRKGFTLTPGGISKTEKILFTDEKIFSLHHIPNKQNHRMRTHNPKTIPFKQVPVMDSFVYVAGGFYSGGLTRLIFYDSGRLDSDYYIRKILPTYLKLCQTKQLKLQQDGLPVHFSNKTVRAINNSGVELIHESWPGNSPDLVSFFE